MDISIDKKAFEDLEGLTEEISEEVFEKLGKLEDKGISISEVSPWEDNRGELLFRLKIKEEKADHRAFFDIEKNEIIIYGIFHRDEAYENSVKKEIENRIE